MNDDGITLSVESLKKLPVSKEEALGELQDMHEALSEIIEQSEKMASDSAEFKRNIGTAICLIEKAIEDLEGDQ